MTTPTKPKQLSIEIALAVDPSAPDLVQVWQISTNEALGSGTPPVAAKPCAPNAVAPTPPARPASVQPPPDTPAPRSLIVFEQPQNKPIVFQFPSHGSPRSTPPPSHNLAEAPTWKGWKFGGLLALLVVLPLCGGLPGGLVALLGLVVRILYDKKKTGVRMPIMVDNCQEQGDLIELPWAEHGHSDDSYIKTTEDEGISPSESGYNRLGPFDAKNPGLRFPKALSTTNSVKKILS